MIAAAVSVARLERRRRSASILVRAMRGNQRELDQLPPARRARMECALVDQQRRLDALMARPSGLRRASRAWR